MLIWKFVFCAKSDLFYGQTFILVDISFSITHIILKGMIFIHDSNISILHIMNEERNVRNE